MLPSQLDQGSAPSLTGLFLCCFGLQLMGNAVFTFAQLLAPHLGAEASKTAVAMEKVKLRVLKVKPFFHLWEA